MAKMRGAATKSKVPAKRSRSRSNPQKIKSLGNELRSELSNLAKELRAKRKLAEVTEEGRVIIDLRLKFLEELQEDILHICWGSLPVCGCSTIAFRGFP